MKKAFTLAEVLITLGIIGIVAAMTLPTLIQAPKNLEVEAKLKKFYSVMLQAIELSEIDNGDYKYWPDSCGSNHNCISWMEKYISPYFNTIKISKFQSFGGTNGVYYFNDGTAVVFKRGGQQIDFFFFPNAKNLDETTFAELDENGSLANRAGCGISYFAFMTIPPSYTGRMFKGKKFGPYVYQIQSWSEAGLTGGHAYACNKDAALKDWCTALIYYNGWKIPENYPFKVK